MGLRFTELDHQRTELGEYVLRRRRDPVVQREVYEVKLGEEFLMSSLFTAAEIALADLALARLEDRALRVLVGGLGLGYTARAALADPRVRELTVVEAAAPVIDWHRRDLLPDTAGMAGDPRLRIVQDDFFALLRGPAEQRYDAVLLDIDHTPDHVLHPENAAFYTAGGLRDLPRHLTEGGVFGLWSDDPPEPRFTERLADVFGETAAEVVTFDNPLTGGESSNTVYLAR